MRIHLIGINYWPETTGISLFTTGRAEHLASRGHAVVMCTAVPYYPQWRVAEAYRRRPFARDERAGVDIRRSPLYVPLRVTAIRRVVHEASFIATTFLRSLFSRRPDLLFVVSPPLGLALAAILLSKLWRVPYVFHVADLQPDTAVDLGMMKRGRLTRLLYAVERLAYRHAALVSTLTEAMRVRIIAKGIPAAKVVLFADWADPELFVLPIRADDHALRTELGLGNAFVVLHAGNMGVKQGLDVVLDAGERTGTASNVMYVLVGDGAVRADLEARVRASGLTNVRIIPLLPHDRFRRLLAVADVTLVTQRASVADIVFPSKVLTLLAAGKPVIASVSSGSEVARVIHASGAGEVVVPEDPDALVAAVERIRQEPAAGERMGRAGRAYASRQWERTATLEYLAHSLEAVAANGTIEPRAADGGGDFG